MQPLFLDHLSMVDASALKLIEVAAAIGFVGVSLFVAAIPINPALDLLHRPAARADVVRAVRDQGLMVGIVEPFMLDEAPDWPLFERTAALAADIGGDVNAIGFDPEPARLEDAVGRLAGIAAAAGVAMTIEAFPLSAIRTQADALRLARSAGPGVGLCVDTLHVLRARRNCADVAALPPAMIRHVQLSDGPRAEPADRYAEAVSGRLPPGEGEFALAELIPLLPGHARIAVEAPFAAPDPRLEDRARRLMDGARGLFAGAG